MHLDVSDGSAKGGVNVQIFKAHSGTAQSFGIVGTSNGNYCIKPICSGLFLDISGNKTEDGTNVSQWSDTGATGQRWVFQDAGGGYYYICSESGMYLDVADTGKTSGTNVWAWSYNGANAQKWKLERKTLIDSTLVKVADQVFTGKVLTPAPTVTTRPTASKKPVRLVKGTDYSVSYANNVNVGTATVTVKGKGNYTGTKSVTFKIAKAAQPMTVKTNKKSANYATLKHRAAALTNAITVKKNQGAVSYENVSAQKAAKKFTVNSKNGKITVPKKTKKGTYNVKAKVTAKGNASYKPGSKTVTVKVTVK